MQYKRRFTVVWFLSIFTAVYVNTDVNGRSPKFKHKNTDRDRHHDSVLAARIYFFFSNIIFVTHFRGRDRAQRPPLPPIFVRRTLLIIFFFLTRTERPRDSRARAYGTGHLSFSRAGESWRVATGCPGTGSSKKKKIIIKPKIQRTQNTAKPITRSYMCRGTRNYFLSTHLLHSKTVVRRQWRRRRRRRRLDRKPSAADIRAEYRTISESVAHHRR